MSRNAESRFALAPQVGIQRSTFKLNNSVKTSFNVGDIIPFHLSEVLPGDTFDVKTSKVVRLQTLLTPIMDNIYLDTYYFFVPNRLVWEHWKQFMGENTESAWLPETQYTMPQITAPSGGWNINTLADYFGLPTGVSNISVSALPFRAYAKIMDDWFRDENLTDPLLIPVNDSTQTGSNGSSYVTDVANGGKPFKASKYHDYFTSCLPSPQKGPDVTIPLGKTAGVFTSSVPYDYSLFPKSPDTGLASALSFANVDGTPLASGTHNIGIFSAGTDRANTNTYSGDPGGISASIYPNNLYADLTNATAASINQLRLAFQIQKFYEKDARSGTRYIETIKAHFGVTSPDARLQRSEYLGGNRVPININQVVQNSATGSTPQGNVAAMSLTVDTNRDFKRSFTEHGYVVGVMVARYDHTYQQGIERHWSRKDKFDFYWPVFANIGEQAVKNKEIYAQGNAQDDEVFGYQEAFAEYRYKPSFVTGEMRSRAPQSLDSWHLGDDYESLPHLSDEWIREDSSTVNRVLAVSENLANQLFADVYVQNIATRPMPMFSIPGLMDHH